MIDDVEKVSAPEDEAKPEDPSMAPTQEIPLPTVDAQPQPSEAPVVADAAPTMVDEPVGEIAAAEEETQTEPASLDPSQAETIEQPVTVTAAAPIVPVDIPEEAEEQSASSVESVEEDSTEASEEASEEEEEEENRPLMPELDPERAALPWYCVHAYSGYEAVAKKNLEERIRAHGLEPKFGNVLVPQETVVELVRGVKKTSTRKFFPGYILVQMNLDSETWHLVKDTPKITGFVGESRDPAPLTEAEVGDLLKQMEGGASRPRPRVQFEEGDAVKVIDGPFTDFNGTVDEVKPDKGKLRVLISIFGRNTPVELDFVQVEKA